MSKEKTTSKTWPLYKARRESLAETKTTNTLFLDVQLPEL
jgi:hypothetical protein